MEAELLEEDPMARFVYLFEKISTTYLNYKIYRKCEYEKNLSLSSNTI